jgi:hypothetical protein
MNAWKSWLAAMLTVAAAGLVLAGCNGRSTIDTGQGDNREVAAPSALMARANPPIPDLPVPIGFDLDAKKSRSVAAGGLRMVDHRYTGRVNKWVVGRFYKRQMPLAQWALHSDRMIQGTIFLDFSKGNESCFVVIGDAPLWSTSVMVQIYPTTKIQPR